MCLCARARARVCVCLCVCVCVCVCVCCRSGLDELGVAGHGGGRCAVVVADETTLRSY